MKVSRYDLGVMALQRRAFAKIVGDIQRLRPFSTVGLSQMRLV